MSNNKFDKIIMSIYRDLKIYAIATCGGDKYHDPLHNTVAYLLERFKAKHKVQPKDGGPSFLLTDHPNLLAYAKLKLKGIWIDKNKKKSEIQIPVDEDGNELDLPDIDYDEEKDIRLRTMYNAMEKISEKCRELLLQTLAGDSPEEIAIKLDVPIGTVGSRKNRCQEELKDVVNA